jgi:hypothetical protein
MHAAASKGLVAQNEVDNKPWMSSLASKAAHFPSSPRGRESATTLQQNPPLSSSTVCNTLYPSPTIVCGQYSPVYYGGLSPIPLSLSRDY